MTDELPLSAGTRLRIEPNVYARSFDDEIVLLDFARGEYFGLDAVGATVWRGVEDGLTLAAIATRIASEFDVEEEQALADILDLARDLARSQLVVITPP